MSSNVPSTNEVAKQFGRQAMFWPSSSWLPSHAEDLSSHQCPEGSFLILDGSVLVRGVDVSNIKIITASAGSGKTTRLTEVLREALVRGDARPDAVVATTFTNKAAAELQERARQQLLAAGRTADAHRLGAARIGTVNAVCGGLVDEFAFELGLAPDVEVIDDKIAAETLNKALASAVPVDMEQELALQRIQVGGQVQQKLNDAANETSWWEDYLGYVQGNVQTASAAYGMG